MSHNKDEIAAMVLEGEKLRIEGASLPQKVEDLRLIAQQMRAAPRAWRTSGSVLRGCP